MYSIVMVVPAGRNCGPRVSKDALPLEIPLPDVDQPLSSAVGQRRKALDLLCEVVGVRLHGVDIHVGVQAERIGHDIAPFARRDVHVLSRQPDEHRVQSRRPSLKYKPRLACTVSSFPLGLRCSIMTRSVCVWQRPGHSLRRDVRRVSRKPAEKKPLRAADRMRNQPFVAGFRILRVEPARRSGGIELHRRMMDDARIARRETATP